MVNGYPSTVVYPYADVSLTPDKVKTSVIPSLTDSNKYTEFTFDVPVYLLPGEHSIVLLSNSVGYEAFVGEIGQVNIANSVKIWLKVEVPEVKLRQAGTVMLGVSVAKTRVFTEQIAAEAASTNCCSF